MVGKRICVIAPPFDLLKRIATELLAAEVEGDLLLLVSDFLSVLLIGAPVRFVKVGLDLLYRLFAEFKLVHALRSGVIAESFAYLLLDLVSSLFDSLGNVVDVESLFQIIFFVQI